MKLPVIQGIIRRRILVNFRVQPEVMQRLLPHPFRPKLHRGFAIAGICLIRLEQIRPQFLKLPVGISSENAAHRIAVLWESEEGQTKEGVFIPRRDTSSLLNHLAGGKIFPGEHQQARFTIEESDKRIELSMDSTDGKAAVRVTGSISNRLPKTSCFSDLNEASHFFEGGSTGYSVTSNASRLDGLTLHTKEWRMEPLQIETVHSSYFSDETKFPKGSVEFDCALLMRNISHEWHAAPDLYAEPRLAAHHSPFAIRHSLF